MPKKRLLWTLIAALAFTACNKRTEVSGKITSHDGGKPVEGIPVWLTAYRAVKSRVETVDRVGDTTDANGEYLLCIDDRKNEYSKLEIDKTGYGDPVFFGFDAGESAVVDYTVYPRDAYVHMTFHNTQDTTFQELYYSFSGPGYEDKVYHGPEGRKPYTLPALGTLQKVAPVTGELDVTVMCSLYKGIEKTRTIKVTAFCPRGDTTYIDFTL